MRCCSVALGPGRAPLSRSPWRTHLRSVSAVQPILPAIDSIAAHCDGYWSLASKTMRTARSCTSGENFGDFLILAPFPIEGASSIPGAVHVAPVGADPDTNRSAGLHSRYVGGHDCRHARFIESTSCRHY